MHGAIFSIFIVLVIFNVGFINMRRFIRKDEPEALALDEVATNERYEEFGLMNLYENHA